MGVGSKIRELIDYYYSKKNEKNVVSINIPKNKSNLLENKVALIVGGTGGIGVAIAESFLEAGAKVIISGTREEKVTKTVEKLGNAVRGIQIDLNNVTEFDNKVSQAISLFSENRIDILVNCAGVHGNQKFGIVSELAVIMVSDMCDLVREDELIKNTSYCNYRI